MCKTEHGTEARSFAIVRRCSRPTDDPTTVPVRCVEIVRRAFVCLSLLISKHCASIIMYGSQLCMRPVPAAVTQSRREKRRYYDSPAAASSPAFLAVLSWDVVSGFDSFDASPWEAPTASDFSVFTEEGESMKLSVRWFHRSQMLRQ